MLLFMTYNVWICTATVVGEVFARLIFAVLFGEKQLIKAVSCFELALPVNYLKKIETKIGKT